MHKVWQGLAKVACQPHRLAAATLNLCRGCDLNAAMRPKVRCGTATNTIEMKTTPRQPWPFMNHAGCIVLIFGASATASAYLSPGPVCCARPSDHDGAPLHELYQPPSFDRVVGAFTWSTRFANCLVQAIGHDALQNSALTQSRTQSSFCSGIGTDRLATQALTRAFLPHGVCMQLQHAFSCDNNPRCREVLKHGGGHLWGDIADLVKPKNGVWDASWSYLQKWDAIHHGSVLPSAWCHSCDRPHAVVGADVDISGTPCTDYSAAGLQHRIEGPTNFVFLSYCRFHRSWRTPILIHENVPRCFSYPSESKVQY